MSQALVIREAGPADETRWDAYVAAHPAATLFHRYAWRRVIEGAFGHATHFLIAERGGEPAGLLPLARQKTALFGDGLISLPFCVYGGVLASDDAARQALDDHAVALREKLGSRYLELRERKPVRLDWPRKSELYATFRRPIVAEPEKNLLAIPRKQRAVVRKALENKEMTVEVDDSIDRIYAIYCLSVRNLGTPVFSRRLFELSWRELRESAEVVTVKIAGEAVTSCLSFFFKDEVLPYFAGGTAAARGGAYDLMYYTIMNRAAARGCRVFDFGRSKAGTGPFSFKKNWGFEPEFLSYEYALAPGQSIPENNPLNPKYRMFIAAWKRLPLPVANLVGPILSRGLG
ncbi:MAG: FemAB family PEP-CTERM system-associated protein [Alphaproteobacteria bacterium]|nr:FemAB family PEP-CTERM system-associated protein [Alphaproteobacteria bacterium]